MGPHLGDPTTDQPPRIGSIPLSPSEYSYLSGTLGATSILTITWNVTVVRPELSLWNFHQTLVLGPDVVASYRWPDGSSLGANEKAVFFSWWVDQYLSNDYTNKHVLKFVARNDSASSMPYTHHFKSYSFATATGGSA